MFNTKVQINNNILVSPKASQNNHGNVNSDVTCETGK